MRVGKAHRRNKPHLFEFHCRLQVLFVWTRFDHEDLAVGQANVFLWVLHAAMLCAEISVQHYRTSVFIPKASPMSFTAQICRRAERSALIGIILPIIWEIHLWVGAGWALDSELSWFDLGGGTMADTHCHAEFEVSPLPRGSE